VFVVDSSNLSKRHLNFGLTVCKSLPFRGGHNHRGVYGNVREMWYVYGTDGIFGWITERLGVPSLIHGLVVLCDR